MKNKKFKKVSFNNTKKQLVVFYTSGKKIALHYSSLGIRSNLTEAWIDKETHSQSVGIKYSNGKVDFMPYDQPLAIVKDPEFLLQTQMECLIAQIKEEIKTSKISKRYLAEQLHTSDNQIQRLLDPKILNKNLSQLYQISSILGLEVQMRLRAA